MTTFYGYRGDFSNRYTVAAFPNREARDKWLAKAKGNEVSRVLTRKEARALLADKLDAQDFRVCVGCYAGSQNFDVDQARREDAEHITAEVRAACFDFDGATQDWVPNGIEFCNPPVRL